LADAAREALNGAGRAGTADSVVLVGVVGTFELADGIV